MKLCLLNIVGLRLVLWCCFCLGLHLCPEVAGLAWALHWSTQIWLQVWDDHRQLWHTSMKYLLLSVLAMLLTHTNSIQEYHITAFTHMVLLGKAMSDDAPGCLLLHVFSLYSPAPSLMHYCQSTCGSQCSLTMLLASIVILRTCLQTKPVKHSSTLSANGRCMVQPSLKCWWVSLQIRQGIKKRKRGSQYPQENAIKV